MKTQSLPYEADGLAMTGHLAFDAAATEPRPAVLVFPEVFGLGAHGKARAERIAAELGYVALACDLHGGEKIIEGGEVGPLLGEWRKHPSHVQERVLKPLALLAARPEVDASRIAAIGFCYGGTMAFELALTGADIKAAVGFHSGLKVSAPHDGGKIRGKVLAMIGADDPSIPPEDRLAFEQMLRAGKVDWQMTLYGGVVHSFTNPDADRRGRPEFARYDRAADTRSWTQMTDLLAEAFA